MRQELPPPAPVTLALVLDGQNLEPPPSPPTPDRVLHSCTPPRSHFNAPASVSDRSSHRHAGQEPHRRGESLVDGDGTAGAGCQRQGGAAVTAGLWHGAARRDADRSAFLHAAGQHADAAGSGDGLRALPGSSLAPVRCRHARPHVSRRPGQRWAGGPLRLPGHPPGAGAGGVYPGPGKPGAVLPGLSADDPGRRAGTFRPLPPRVAAEHRRPADRRPPAGRTGRSWCSCRG